MIAVILAALISAGALPLVAGSAPCCTTVVVDPDGQVVTTYELPQTLDQALRSPISPSPPQVPEWSLFRF